MRARETRGEGEELPSHPIASRHPFSLRPFQKATNPTAGSPGAGSPQVRRPGYRRLLPSFLACLGEGIYLKGVGHYVYA